MRGVFVDLMDLDFRSLWGQALLFEQFVRASTANADLWSGVYRLSTTPDWARTEACGAGAVFRLLVLAEDWCGDGANTVPHLAKLADQSPCLELRVLRRDEHPDVMDRYLTGTARSIPIVIVLDEGFFEVGHWGPRPRRLQQWVTDVRHANPTAHLYPQIRRWYAQDKGASTLREVLQLLQPAPSAQSVTTSG
jgi:hypothetical protein